MLVVHRVWAPLAERSRRREEFLLLSLYCVRLVSECCNSSFVVVRPHSYPNLPSVDSGFWSAPLRRGEDGAAGPPALRGDVPLGWPPTPARAAIIPRCVTETVQSKALSAAVVRRLSVGCF